jgi:hypothetical protein
VYGVTPEPYLGLNRHSNIYDRGRIRTGVSVPLYITGLGFTPSQASLAFTLYGLAAALAAWISGVVAELIFRTGSSARYAGQVNLKY